ncbi:MAG TPA: sigma-54 dependent transcriptional regulator [Armatimonadaceae bacterium]|nr:sigma-54 dependent transcriptional regulator [Armatimonadaceae bacterium]
MPVEAGAPDPNAATVLIVDDEPNLRRVLAAVLSRDGYNVVIADGGRDAIKKAKQQPSVDVLVTDFLMPDLNGLEVLEAVRRQHPGLRTLLISGHGTVRSAVEAMRLGAFDFLTKPFDVEQVRETVQRAMKAVPQVDLLPSLPATPVSAKANGHGNGGGAAAAAHAAAEPETADRSVAPTAATAALPSGVGFVGDAPATRTVKQQLLAAAASRATVLLLGESGTGKEVSAKLIHEASPRKRGPFIAVSCAALPDTLLESELFGHEKSAFTGALAAKPGRFELADGGTLFLDEIGDIPHLTQVKLLRALQEREISRIGGVKSVKVDVRVVAATNRDLWQAVQEGTFRADLYYRLHVIPVTLPPLRERREDIPALAAHFLERLAKENRRTFPEGFSDAALARLTGHAWPGNIRELQNVVEYAVVMSAPDAVRVEESVLPVLKSRANP